MRLAILLSAATLLAAPAFAQDDAGSTRYTDDALLAAVPCFDAMKSGDSRKQLKDCGAASASLTAMKRYDYTTKHERNVYDSMKSITLVGMATAMAQGAGYQSEESCDVLEDAWQNYANYIQADQSPSRQQEMWDIRQQTLRGVRMCREQYGRPDGASHLPGS